jgi:hypothetical protein
MGRIEWLKPTDSQKIKLNEAREQYEQKMQKVKPFIGAEKMEIRRVRSFWRIVEE